METYHAPGKETDVTFCALEQLPGATETAVSFQIEQEDHTLGNVLRYFITKK